MDNKYRMYISKSGQLRMITNSLENGLVESYNVLEFHITSLAVDNDLLGYFTRHGPTKTYRNKVKFTD